MRFIRWLGTQSNLINGQVIMCFQFGTTVGIIIGIVIGVLL